MYRRRWSARVKRGSYENETFKECSRECMRDVMSRGTPDNFIDTWVETVPRMRVPVTVGRHRDARKSNGKSCEKRPQIDENRAKNVQTLILKRPGRLQSNRRRPRSPLGQPRDGQKRTQALPRALLGRPKTAKSVSRPFQERSWGASVPPKAPQDRPRASQKRSRGAHGRLRSAICATSSRDDF